MNPAEYAMLLISLVSMGAVVLIFGLAAPWYRSVAGCTLFGVKVSFFLIFLVITLAENEVEHPVARALEAAVYPLAALTSTTLLVLMFRTQIMRRGDRIAKMLFQKQPDPEPGWDGDERRASNLEA